MVKQQNANAKNYVLEKAPMPIDWFGDRNAYEQSKVKIITVGLNPSYFEFCTHATALFDTKLRFPTADQRNPITFPIAWNEYFKKNPYMKWFNAFEHVLWGGVMLHM